jgi:peptide deformylase
MSILKVARLGHPILRAKARKVDRREIGTPAVQALVDDMIATLREYGSLGLAAPQVHYDLRVLVAVVPPDGTRIAVDRVSALFNPEVNVLADDLTEDLPMWINYPKLVICSDALTAGSCPRLGAAIGDRDLGLHGRLTA